MILTLLVGLLFGLIDGILGLFPSYELPGSILGVGADIGSALGAVNGIFPVVALGQGLAVMCGVQLFAWGVQLTVWIYRLIPAKFT